MDKRNTNVSTGSPTGISAEVHERDVTEVPNVSTSTAATTPVVLDVEPIGTSSPRISLPEGSPSEPAVTATCRPRPGCNKLRKDRLMNLLEKGI